MGKSERGIQRHQRMFSKSSCFTAALVLTVVMGVWMGGLVPVWAGIVTIPLDPQGGGLIAMDLAQKLVGPGVEVLSADYKGDDSAAGTFTGGLGIIGIEEGVILSSGRIADVVGPNNSNSTTTTFCPYQDPPPEGEECVTTTDDDLQTLITEPIFDAAVLEFGFLPSGSSVTLKYVFTSEEYNEFANSPFNNVFGFFVNGVNYALLPDNVTVVAINKVNGGSPAECTNGLDDDGDGAIDMADSDCSTPGDDIVGEWNQNSQYFFNNCGDPVFGEFIDTCPCIGSEEGCPKDIEADGVLKILTITAPVNAGEPNHIKLAIGDAGDSVLDSWIFIEQGSFTIADQDKDGIRDDEDNCVDVPNQEQKDKDNDDVGDACDNCPEVPNGPAQAELEGVGNQTDSDGDGVGDACDNADIGGQDSETMNTNCCIQFTSNLPNNDPADAFYTIDPEIFVHLDCQDEEGNDLQNPLYSVPADVKIKVNDDLSIALKPDSDVVRIDPPWGPECYEVDLTTRFDSDILEKAGKITCTCTVFNPIEDPDDPGADDYVDLRNFRVTSEPFTVNLGTIEINIDVKPGSDTNPINLTSGGNVPVAILGSDQFDVTNVIPETLIFAESLVKVKKKGAVQFSYSYVNGDEFLDMVAHFPTIDILDLPLGSTIATLEGKAWIGGMERNIIGTDNVIIVKDGE